MTIDKNMNIDQTIKIIEQPITVFDYYKKPGLLVPIGISCTFKCEDCINKPHIWDYIISEVQIKTIIDLYQRNPLVESLILAGLEPFDSPHDLTLLIDVFRQFSIDDVVLYTGYDLDDIETNKSLLELLFNIIRYDNIIIKFGRYIPNKKEVFNKILGITLKSDNQWAMKTSRKY